MYNGMMHQGQNYGTEDSNNSIDNVADVLA